MQRVKFDWRKILLVSLIFIVAFVGLVKFTTSAAPKLERDSKLALDEFMTRCQKRNYTSAYQLFTPNLQSSLSLAVLTQDWQRFEKTHGGIRNWKRVNGMVSMGYPRFVESVYQVSGQKSGAGMVRVRLVPQDDTWRVDRILIYP